LKTEQNEKIACIATLLKKNSTGEKVSNVIIFSNLNIVLMKELTLLVVFIHNIVFL